MPELSLKGVTRQLRQGQTEGPATLGPWDLTVASGECVCLSGPSGSGKSLLLRAIADLDPHEGEVRLDASLCGDMPAPHWRRRVSLLPAESQWWYDRVGQHFGDYDSEYLALLGFDAEAMDWSVSRCSTGERQRLALLRVLALHPQALLLDEPTASLDPDNVKRVEQLITHYRQDKQAAVLWVSHDMAQIARVSERHLRMRSDGQCLEAA